MYFYFDCFDSVLSGKSKRIYRIMIRADAQVDFQGLGRWGGGTGVVREEKGKLGIE